MSIYFGFLRNVNFDDKLNYSPFIRATRMHFEREGMQVSWDLALEHDSVSVLLYHKVKKCFLFVKQFRPAVFVQRVRQLPGNSEKTLNSIDWNKYPISLGETIELCSGLMDKRNKTPLEMIREEILEECGYIVDAVSIKLVKKFLTGVGISGSSQNLFYAEIDESMKDNEGGGLTTEGEIIEKIFMTVNDAQKLLEDETSFVDSPPNFLYAISWFLKNKSYLIFASEENSQN